MPHKNIEVRRKYHRDYKERIGKEVIADKHRAWRLPRIYGISLEDYKSLFSAQGHRCALCRKHESEFKRGYKLAVDHCHETGKIRGLLCYHCNSTLSKGLEYFERVIEYFNTFPVDENGQVIKSKIRLPNVIEVDNQGKIIYN